MPTFDLRNLGANRTISGGLKVVDISDKPVEAEVLRDGRKVPSVKIREDLVADFVAPDRLDGRIVQTRVVYQAVPAGKRVARGTVVDLVLSNPYLIGTDFIAGSHRDLSERSIGQVADTFFVSDEIRRSIQLAEDVDELPPATRAAIETAAAENEITIDSTDPERDLQSLYVAIKAADVYR